MAVTMNDSILNTIKKLLGPTETYDYFDTDIIIHINTAIATLYQMGIGPKNFHVTDETETWADLLGTDNTVLEMAKTYIYLKVRLIFDPPATGGGVMDAINNTIKELEWRLNSEVDYHTKGE
jgi:hypothetical protein